MWLYEAYLLTIIACQDMDNKKWRKDENQSRILQIHVLTLQIQAQRFLQYCQPGLRSLENTDARKASFPLEISWNDLLPDIIISPETFIKAFKAKATQTQKIWKLKILL